MHHAELQEETVDILSEHGTADVHIHDFTTAED